MKGIWNGVKTGGAGLDAAEAGGGGADSETEGRNGKNVTLHVQNTVLLQQIYNKHIRLSLTLFLFNSIWVPLLFNIDLQSKK